LNHNARNEKCKINQVFWDGSHFDFKKVQTFPDSVVPPKYPQKFNSYISE